MKKIDCVEECNDEKKDQECEGSGDETPIPLAFRPPKKGVWIVHAKGEASVKS